jgi:hypothetical protein
MRTLLAHRKPTRVVLTLVSELPTIHPKSSKVIKWLLGMACLRFLQALIGG